MTIGEFEETALKFPVYGWPLPSRLLTMVHQVLGKDRQPSSGCFSCATFPSNF